MSYNKKDWHNLPDISTPISATDLNRMEEGIADANGAIGADAYDSTATYAINDLCIYNNTLYICTTAIITAEDFTAAHWKAISVKDMLIVLNESGGVVTNMNKTISVSNINGMASTTNNGLMSSSDFKKINPQSIEANTDLNTITDVGWYYCSTNAIATTLSNCPVNVAFYLEVNRHAGQHQRIITYETSNYKEYSRNAYNGTWGAWRQHVIEGLPLTGGTLTGNLTSRQIAPSANDSYDLGTSRASWRNLYLNERINSSKWNQYSSGNTLVIGTAEMIAVRSNSNIETPMPIQASAFNQWSSRRYKKNIEDISDKRANLLDNIRVVTYDYKNEKNGKNLAGVIAEEVEKIIPEVVTYTEINGEKVADGVDYSKFVPYLIKKVQMLQDKINKVEKKVN